MLSGVLSTEGISSSTELMHFTGVSGKVDDVLQLKEASYEEHVSPPATLAISLVSL